MSYILGFDVSLTRTGWAALDYESGDLVECGVIKPPAEDSLYERLKFLACASEDVVASFGPENINAALEGGFSARSGKITRLLAMAWIMVALTIYDLTGYEPLDYPPTKVKQIATGKGNAGKEEVIAAAQARWDIEEDSDIADACWVAELCRVQLKEIVDDGD